VQIPFNLPQYHPQNINFHLQQLGSQQQAHSKADFDERQGLQNFHPLQQQHNLQVQRLQQQQQQIINIPSSQPTLQEFQQRQQLRQQQLQQQQTFNAPIFLPPPQQQQPQQRLQQQNVDPQFLFKNHASDLFAINNLADRSIDNSFRDARNNGFVDPQLKHLAPGPNPAFYHRNDAHHPQQSRSFSHLIINSSQGQSDTFIRYN